MEDPRVKNQNHPLGDGLTFYQRGKCGEWLGRQEVLTVFNGSAGGRGWIGVGACVCVWVFRERAYEGGKEEHDRDENDDQNDNIE